MRRRWRKRTTWPTDPPPPQSSTLGQLIVIALLGFLLPFGVLWLLILLG